MGYTKGSLEVRTIMDGSMIAIETRASIEDSDNDPECQRCGAQLNAQLSNLISNYQAAQASGRALPYSPQKLLEQAMEGERR